jgi:hypothetical protein
MRRVVIVFAVLLQVVTTHLMPWFVAPAAAVALAPGELATSEAVLRWINGYRKHPDVAHVPNALRALSQLGAFKDPENAGVYVGFLAGVIGSNPSRAEDLVGKLFPMPAEDQWVIVRAIAYSGLPEWKTLLRRFAERMPTRRVMIEKYLAGKLPTLDQLRLDDPPGMMQRIGGYMDVTRYFRAKKPEPVVLTATPDVLDTLWGYYFATAGYPPIARVLTMLAWSKDKDDVERLTIGNMAKYTLASNAARDATLLAMIKGAAPQQPKKVADVLNEVIDAAETVEIARIRKEALDSIEDVKRKGPAYKRDVSWWGQVGQGALAAGCVVAAATGHVEFGLPCVVGGGLSTAALNFWGGTQ